MSAIEPGQEFTHVGQPGKVVVLRVDHGGLADNQVTGEDYVVVMTESGTEMHWIERDFRATHRALQTGIIDPSVSDGEQVRVIDSLQGVFNTPESS